MRLPMRIRLLLGALLITMMTVVLGRAAVRRTIRYAVVPPEWSISERSIEQCLAAPELWSETMLELMTTHAYRTDGSSRNPSAPPLHVGALAAFDQNGAPKRVWKGLRQIRVQRVADDGDCAIFQLTFTLPVSQHRALTIILFFVALTMGLTGLFTQFYAVNPLRRRILRVRDAAGRLGHDDYPHRIDQVGDALSEISAVLDSSHDRIVSDRTELLRRHRALERHLAEVAHDLRTPLSSLLLALQELGDQPAARRALSDASYVATLVDNLHEATRLRQGAPVANGESDLTVIVSRLGARFRVLGRQMGVEVGVSVPDGPIRVRCAPVFAERAIANLLHNALQHGGGGGQVAIVLDEAPTGFAVSVLDGGPGLPRDRREAIIHAAFHPDPERRRTTHLGLAIVNTVVAGAGWEIGYHDVEPSGLRVTIVGDGIA